MTGDPSAVLTSSALGSGVAVALYEPQRRVGGVLHFLLPDRSLDPEAAVVQPALFADSGFELLLRQLEQLGGRGAETLAYLVGGADPVHRGIGRSEAALGARNAAAARELILGAGLTLAEERSGGSRARVISLDLAAGAVRITEAPASGGSDDTRR